MALAILQLEVQDYVVLQSTILPVQVDSDLHATMSFPALLYSLHERHQEY